MSENLVRLTIQTDTFIKYNLKQKHIKLNYKEPILYNENLNKQTITKGEQ